jgi:hypothetical protein
MKWGCLLAGLAALACAVVLAVVAGFWYYTTTPTYSIGRIEKAVRERDTALFEKHVDLEALLGRAFDQVLSPGSRQGEGSGGWGDLGRVLGATLLKPQVVGKLKQQVLADVAAGRMPAAESLSTRPTFEGLEAVRREGAQALATLRVREGQRLLLVEVRLRDRGGYWQAIEIANLRQLVAQYE